MENRKRLLSAFILVFGTIPAVLSLTGLVQFTLAVILVAMLAGSAGSYWLNRSAAAQAYSKLACQHDAVNSQVSDLKQEIRALAKTNVRYDRLMAATNDAVVIVDKNGKIVEANWTIAELLGYESRELTDQHLYDLAPAMEKNRINDFISSAFKNGLSTTEDLMLNHREDSSFWFDGRAGRIENDNGDTAQIVLKDISESKRQFILTEKEISFLHELSRTLPLLQDFDQMLDRILGMLSETLPFNAFTLVLAEPDDTMATICVSDKTTKAFLGDVRDSVADVLSELGDNIDPDQVEYVIERKSGIEEAEGKSVGSQILLPLAIVNGVAGLFSSKPNAFKKEDLSLFSTMVSGISSLYIAYKSYQQVQHLSVTDSLTGLYNRRKFFEELKREVERISRYESPLSLIMLDIDHFKNVNDKYGHQMGDEVLRVLAGVLIDNTRKTDIVARYGGEEFIILLTETPIDGARDVANRIKQAVEKETVLGAAVEIRFTVSLGLANFRAKDTVDDLIGRTDQALYAAKKNGRNRVELITA